MANLEMKNETGGFGPHGSIVVQNLLWLHPKLLFGLKPCTNLLDVASTSSYARPRRLLFHHPC